MSVSDSSSDPSQDSQFDNLLRNLDFSLNEKPKIATKTFVRKCLIDFGEKISAKDFTHEIADEVLSYLTTREIFLKFGQYALCQSYLLSADYNCVELKPDNNSSNEQLQSDTKHKENSKEKIINYTGLTDFSALHDTLSKLKIEHSAIEFTLMSPNGLVWIIGDEFIINGKIYVNPETKLLEISNIKHNKIKVTGVLHRDSGIEDNELYIRKFGDIYSKVEVCWFDMDKNRLVTIITTDEILACIRVCKFKHLSFLFDGNDEVIDDMDNDCKIDLVCHIHDTVMTIWYPQERKNNKRNCKQDLEENKSNQENEEKTDVLKKDKDKQDKDKDKNKNKDEDDITFGSIDIQLAKLYQLNGLKGFGFKGWVIGMSSLSNNNNDNNANRILLLVYFNQGAVPDNNDDNDNEEKMKDINVDSLMGLYAMYFDYNIDSKEFEMKKQVHIELPCTRCLLIDRLINDDWSIVLRTPNYICDGLLFHVILRFQDLKVLVSEQVYGIRSVMRMDEKSAQLMNVLTP